MSSVQAKCESMISLCANGWGSLGDMVGNDMVDDSTVLEVLWYTWKNGFG